MKRKKDEVVAQYCSPQNLEMLVFELSHSQETDSHEDQTLAMPTGVRSYLIDALRVRIAEKVTLEWLEYCARDFDRLAHEFVSNQPLPRGDGKKRRKVRKRPVPGDL